MEQKKGDSFFTNYRLYLGINTVLLIVIIILLVMLIRGNSEKTSDQPKTEEVQNEIVESDTDSSETEAEAEPEPVNELEENTHASIDRLIERYCSYIASGDVESLEDIVDVLTDEEKEKIQKRSEFIEAFDNITCYTMDGPVEDSYIVFVCYDMKLINIDTSAPDIICLYVGPYEEDGRRIHYGNIDESMLEYVAELEQDPKVQELYNDVSARYQAAQESDETLAAFVQRINGQVAEEEPEEEQEAEPQEEAQQEENAEESSQPQVTAQNRETRVTDTINIRSEANTESERVTLAYQGDSITQIESYDNGWSKVEYKGVTGYVMTEYLE